MSRRLRPPSSGRPDKTIDLLLVTDSLNVGGLERLVIDTANFFASNGWRVAVAAAPTGSLWQALDANVRHIYIGSRGTRTGHLFTLLHLYRAVKSARLVHSHQRLVSLFCFGLAKIHRIVHVEHVHNVFTPVSHRRTSFISDNLVACCNTVRDVVVNEYGRSSTRVAVIRNGIPLSPTRLSAEQVKQLSLPDAEQGKIRILGIGRLEPQKNPLRFVRIVKLLQDHGLNIEASWLGNGSLQLAMQESIDNCDLRDVITLEGTVDPTPFLQRSQVLLMTSDWEGLPLTAIEAMSAGCAVLSTSVGGVPEVVDHLNTGYLFSPAAPDEEISRDLAPRLAKGEHSKWGESSYQKIDGSYSTEAMCEQLYQYYCQRLDEAERPRRNGGLS